DREQVVGVLGEVQEREADVYMPRQVIPGRRSPRVGRAAARFARGRGAGRPARPCQGGWGTAVWAMARRNGTSVAATIASPNSTPKPITARASTRIIRVTCRGVAPTRRGRARSWGRSRGHE